LLLNGILRPVPRRDWAALVASMNGLPESRLEEFLFGASRIPLGQVRARLSSSKAAGASTARTRCVAQRTWTTSSPGLATQRAARNAKRAGDIAQAAEDFTWERDAARSRSVAVATYSRLDEGAKVWIEGATLVGLEKTRVERALAGWG